MRLCAPTPVWNGAMRKRGFTLMELLVVVAIVAILAAMIMPVLLQAKEAARMTKCVQNLRQMGSAISRYMDDHNGMGLPPAPWDDQVYTNPWVVYVEPLVTDYISQAPVQPRTGIGTAQPQKIWICPGDISRTSRAPGNSEADNDRPCWWWWGSSYLYPGPTAYMTGDGTDFFQRGASIVPRKPSNWKNPKRDILLADYWFDFHIGRRVKKDVTKPEIIPSSDVWMRDADVKTVNILFLDLHIASVTGPQRETYVRNTVERDNPYHKSTTKP